MWHLSAAAAERWDYDVGEFNSARPAVKSFDGKIECKDVGSNTVDYDWCNADLTAYDATEAYEKGEQEVFKAKLEVLKNEQILTQDPNDPTSGLRAQLEMLKEAKSQADISKWSSTVRLAVLTGMAAGHASLKGRTIDRCKKSLSNAIPTTFVSCSGSSGSKTLLSYILNDSGMESFKTGASPVTNVMHLALVELTPNQIAKRH